MTKSKVDILNACPKTSINFGTFLDGDAKQSQTLKAHPSAEPDPGCHKEMTNRKKILTKNKCREAKFSHKRDFGVFDPA